MEERGDVDIDILIGLIDIYWLESNPTCQYLTWHLIF